MGLPIEFYKAGSGAFEQYLDTQQAKADRGFEMAKMLTPMFVQEWQDNKNKSEKENKNLNLLYDTLGNKATNALASLHPNLLQSDQIVTDATTYLDSYGGVSSSRWNQIVSDLDAEEPVLSSTERYNSAKAWLTENAGIGGQTFDFMNQEHIPTEDTQSPAVAVQEAPVVGQPSEVTDSTFGTPPPQSTSLSTNIYATQYQGPMEDHPYLGTHYKMWKDSTGEVSGMMMEEDLFWNWLDKEVELTGPDGIVIRNKDGEPQKTTNRKIIDQMMLDPYSPVYNPGAAVDQANFEWQQENRPVTINISTQQIMALIIQAQQDGDTELAHKYMQQAIALGVDPNEILGVTGVDPLQGAG